MARSKEEELPNPELYVRFLLLFTEDVTQRVLGSISPNMSEADRRSVIDSVILAIQEEVHTKDSSVVGVVDAYYGGNEFGCLFTEILMTYAWFSHLHPSSENLVGIQITGCGPGTRETFQSFAFMLIKTTNRPIIRPIMCLTNLNMWRLFPRRDIGKAPFA